MRMPKNARVNDFANESGGNKRTHLQRLDTSEADMISKVRSLKHRNFDLENLRNIVLEEDELNEVDFVYSDMDSQQTLQEVAEQTTYGLVFLNDLIKRQRALSLSVAITWLVLLLSLPLLNYWLRDVAYFEVFGFPINWMFLAILIYPVIWVLAIYFVSTADKYEEEFTRLVK